jgi:hypothetical protein
MVKQKPQLVRNFRFENVGGDDLIIVTRACLLKLLVQSATTGSGNLSKTIFSSIKINHISLWGSNISTEFSTVSLEWESQRGPAVLLTDTGTLSSPAHISTKPPRESLAGYWSQVSTLDTRNEPLFRVSSPLHSIIDVHVSFVLSDGSAEGIDLLTVPPGTYIGLVANTLDNTNANGTARVGEYHPVSLTFKGTYT